MDDEYRSSGRGSESVLQSWPTTLRVTVTVCVPVRGGPGGRGGGPGESGGGGPAQGVTAFSDFSPNHLESVESESIHSVTNLYQLHD